MHFRSEHDKSCVNESVYNELVCVNYRSKAERMLEKVLNEGIGVLTIDNVDYPDLLLKIPDPPVVLYYIGNKNYLKNCFGMVGSRKATGYGKNSALKISSELAENGIVIASGLARGIDTYAHKGAIDSKGKTAAVLGCGVNIIYPSENKKLYYNIIDNGIVLSEYPPDTKPLSYNFPPRNRIISGLSKAIAVIEAGEKSGTLITVDYALAQGREVFALPGNIYSLQSKGTNRLIYQGAIPLINNNDIFQLYNIEPKKDSTVIENILDEQEKAIYDLICQDTSDIDTISIVTGIKPNIVMAVLLSLELKLLIKHKNEGGYMPFK